MKTIGDLLARDLTKKIEEVIKVDQTDEQSVYEEITEYVATDRIKRQYRDLLRAIAEAPAEPHEGVGVWISGFFGSGKSSFAKNLGYVLGNEAVCGQPAGELFASQVKDQRIAALIDLINKRYPTEVVMFDVSVDRAVKRNTERIAEIMYTVLLRELDYAEDYDVAELEIELEQEGQLDDFVARCGTMYGDWRTVRKGAQKVARASAILHEMDPATYPTAEAWSLSLGNKRADITVGKFVERTFELCARRCPGKGLVFIVDEVGQYVARSADKIEDLRAVTEQFGKVSKNMLKAHKAVAPVWVIVTSQEKLDEVVAALDSKRVELAKLQDRFKYRIDMAPADIREVATRRVLAKKDEGVPVLQQLYRQSQGQLNAACRLERSARSSDVTEDDFVQFYPYLPHFVELSIDIMSGIRLQPGAPKHLGGSNRTIIKQAYEMLASERTALAAQPIGTLVTLDKVYELVEGNLSTEKQKDISDIRERYKSTPDDRGMAARVAKVICLLGFVRDLPRTEANIAACLIDEVGKPAPLLEVKQALERLEQAQFVRNTEEGWKLQTAQEKNWETERRALSPRQKDRNDVLREALREIFSEPSLKTYRYRNLRNFPVGISVDGAHIGDEGKVPLALAVAQDEDGFEARLEATRAGSRQEVHRNDIYWVFALTGDIDSLVANLYASRQMVAKYDQMRAQNRITQEEASCLQTEKGAVMRFQAQVRDKLTLALQAGTGLFRGVSRDGSSLGKTLPEILKKQFDAAVPDLYSKLEMAARPLKGSEAEEVLKAANLSGLSQVFYDGEQGLGLVVKQGADYVPNPEADVAKEILDYLKHEHSYGNRDTRTGKALELHFSGLGYGWELDLLRTVLAVLFRAGAIEVSYGGQRFDSYQEPRSREPFLKALAFRSAVFTPAKPIDLKTLKQAVLSYEALSGKTVDMERGAIATAFKKLAEEQVKDLLPVEAWVKANGLPGLEEIESLHATLAGALGADADECVNTLAGEGNSLREARERVQRMREATGDKGLATIRFARLAVSQMWPALAARGEDGELTSTVEDARSLLASDTFYEHMKEIEAAARAIAAAFRPTYERLHSQRAERYAAEIEDIRGRAEWAMVPEEMRAPVLQRMVARACAELELGDELTCRHCSATLDQMESDLAALGGLRSEAIVRIQEITASKETHIERVRLADFFVAGLDSEEAVDAAVERLREHLMKLIHEGAKIVLE